MSSSKPPPPPPPKIDWDAVKKTIKTYKPKEKLNLIPAGSEKEEPQVFEPCMTTNRDEPPTLEDYVDDYHFNTL